jgi:hypothetical protein
LLGTACRVGELSQSRWDWIVGDELMLPKEITKTKEPHTVVLSPFVRRHLNRLRTANPKSEWLFPAKHNDGAVDEKSITKQITDRQRGNTRLLAQLQLWEETADPRFETVPVVIRAWCAESDVLAGHLIENEQRSDLTFWDKAQGVVALKAALEQERAAALSLRQWESALLDLGIDTRQLAENLRALRHSNEEAALAAYFVSHGASREMLHQLFHLSHNTITRQRRRLGVRLGQGRPPLPDLATRDAIHRRWADLGRQEIDLRRRLQQLHHQFAAYPLVVLSAVLHEFDIAPATTPPPRESA